MNPWLFGGRSARSLADEHLGAARVPRLQLDASTLAAIDRVHLIEGPRGSGKSSLLEALLAEMERPLILDLSEPSARRWLERAEDFRGDVDEAGLAPRVLYLREAHHHRGIARFVRDLVATRPGFPIWITARSSFVRAEARELDGLLRRHRLLGYSLAEIEGALAGEDGERSRRHQRRMLRFGGLPGIWAAEDPGRLLGDLVQQVLQEELVNAGRVHHPGAYESVLEECARRPGQLVNASEISTAVGVCVGTVQRYLGLLEEVHLLRMAPCFAGGKRREVTRAVKAFLLDNGMRNALLGRLREDGDDGPDRQADLVTWVFGELTKLLPDGQPVRFWRSLSGADVDFVVDPPGSLLAIEVRAEALARPRLARASRSFLRAYAPDEFWVLNDELEATESIGTTVVRWLPIWKLPDRIREWAGTVWVGAHRRARAKPLPGETDQSRRSR